MSPLIALLLACAGDPPPPPPEDATTTQEGPGWTLDGEVHEQLRTILANREEWLIQYVDAAAVNGDPTMLYDAQILTSNVARAARLLGDTEMIERLAGIYLAAHDDLEEHSDYLFYYWPGDDYLSRHPLSEPARMWVDGNGLEVIQESAQFLYAVVYLIHAVLDLEPEERSETMLRLVQDYASVLAVDHYARWIFTSTPFEVMGWRCDAGLMTHEQYMEARIDNGLCVDDPDRYSYLNALHDIDTWIVSGAVELVAAHQRDPDLVPLEDDLEAQLLDYVAMSAALIHSRFEDTELVDLDGSPVTGVGFDLGVWRDHPDHAYSAYEGSDYPSSSVAGAIPDGQWDVSHARRFVQVFDTLSRHSDIVSSDAFDQDFLEALTAQLLYGAFEGDLARPRLNNFMDGGNGWYRVNLEAGTGYGPNDLTNTLVNGGYGFWRLHDPALTTVMTSLQEILSSGVVLDESGEEHHGVLAGGTWTDAGPVGGALQLEDDGYLDLGWDDAYTSEQGAIELWFFSDLVGDGDDLVNIFETSYTDYLVITRWNSQVKVYIEDDDEELLYVFSENEITPGVWTHLVVSQDTTGVRIFLDGVESPTTHLNSGAWSGHMGTAGAWVGSGHWHSLVGGIDEVRIYDRPLSADEVAAHATGLFEDDTGLVGWWSFSEALDSDKSAWLSEHYSVDTNPTDSLDLLQFLPVFVAPE